MCQTNTTHCIENGIQNYLLKTMDNILIDCIYFSKGCANSNTRPQLPSKSALEKGLYMDEAISKISEHARMASEILSV